MIVTTDREQQWWATAAAVESRNRGSNPDAYRERFGEAALADRGREGILTMAHLTISDGHRPYRHMDVWDLDRLAEDGWTEYPVPGPGRVYVKPGVGVATVHALQSYRDDEVPEHRIPKPNTLDGQHVVIQRIGKKSADLVEKMLTAAATVLEV